MTSHSHSRPLLLATLAALATALGVLGLTTVPALAKQVHYYSKSFGTAGSGPGQLSEPAGVAVSETGAFSGDIYVVDQGNDRIEVFSGEGAYISQFNGAATPGKAFSWPHGQPQTIAVDNSTNPLDPSKGDVYVTDIGSRAIDKFGPEGAYLGQITKGAGGKPFGGLNEAHNAIEMGVAVDQQGMVWIDQRNEEETNTQLDRFSDAVKNELLGSISLLAFNFGYEAGPIAVDSEDNIYVTGLTNVALTEISSVSGRSVLTGDHSESGTGVAVDPATDEVYFDDIERAGSVEVYSASGSLIQSFGTEQLGRGSSGIAVSVASGAVYATSTNTDTVKVFVNAILPDVSTGEASALQNEGSATLNGTVNPAGVPLTTCKFEYVPDETYEADRVNEAQLLSVSGGATGGTFTLTLGAETTEAISYDPERPEATVEGIRAAMEQLRSLAYHSGAEIDVSGSGAGHFRIEFVGPLGETRFPQLTADASDLTPAGSTVTVETAVEGDNGWGAAASAPCASIPAGGAPTAVHSEITVTPDTGYHDRLVAGNANTQVEAGQTLGGDQKFVALARAAIAGEAATEVGSTSATASAQINPGGSLTSYRVEYGAGVASGSSTPEVTLGAGLDSAGVQVHLSGLQPGTLYQLRFVATNALGVAPGGEVAFTTSQAVGGVGLTLPDSRAYELVSSPTQNANVFRPFEENLEDEGDFRSNRPMRAAADGNEVAFLGEPPRATTGEGSGNTNRGIGNQYIAVRSASGWTDTDLQLTPNIEYVNFTPDLSRGVLLDGGSERLPGAEPALPPMCTTHNLYSLTTGDGAYHALVAAPIPDPAFCGGEFAGSSADGSQLFFQSEAALTPAAKSGGEKHFNLYDSVAGQLHLVNVLPDGEPDDNARFGSPTARSSSLGRASFNNVISADGSRVFWSEVTPSSRFHEDIDALFVRENDAQPQSPLGPQGECTEGRDACTARIDVPEAGAEGGAGVGEFWYASSDGSKAFFTDCSRLTKGSTAAPIAHCLESDEEPYTPSGNDLYEYDTDTGRLTDLTVDRNPGDALGADVQGVVGVNETGAAGAYVYLVADGVLTAGNNAEGDEPASGQPNLYLIHAGVVSFIATLSPTDDSLYSGLSDRTFGDWQAEAGIRTAEPTPDGHSLAFMSTQPLAGHATSGTPQVFVYDADTGRIACASCNPSGTPSSHEAVVPISVYNTFMRRWISADGSRVFFETDEALVPQDTNGVQDVYEWEREGAGSCTRRGGCVYLLSGTSGAENAYLVDASANGDDVFFATRTPLVPRAQGGSMALYDARVDGGFPEPSVACAGAGCQGVPPAPPIFATPASVTFNGVGNFEPQLHGISKRKAAKCAKGKIRKAGRCVKKAKAKRRKAQSGKQAKKSGRAGSKKGRK